MKHELEVDKIARTAINQLHADIDERSAHGAEPSWAIVIVGNASRTISMQTHIEGMEDGAVDPKEFADMLRKLADVFEAGEPIEPIARLRAVQ